MSIRFQVRVFFLFFHTVLKILKKVCTINHLQFFSTASTKSLQNKRHLMEEILKRRKSTHLSKELLINSDGLKYIDYLQNYVLKLTGIDQKILQVVTLSILMRKLCDKKWPLFSCKKVQSASFIRMQFGLQNWGRLACKQSHISRSLTFFPVWILSSKDKSIQYQYKENLHQKQHCMKNYVKSISFAGRHSRSNCCKHWNCLAFTQCLCLWSRYLPETSRT